MRLYGELAARWYPLLSRAADYAEEAAVYRDAIRSVAADARTMLELGSGAGHNALHLKADFDCTLTDLSEPMLALSAASNPECEFHLGDMRTMRLGRTFDAVFVHDAVDYMQSEDDLRAMFATAAAHLAPGGAAVFAPDFTKETFEEDTDHYEASEGDRAMRCIEWQWWPDPERDIVRVEYVLALREAGEVQVVHDVHTFGCFARATWERLASEAGFDVRWAPRELSDWSDEILVGRRR